MVGSGKENSSENTAEEFGQKHTPKYPYASFQLFKSIPSKIQPHFLLSNKTLISYEGFGD